jgi:hypothetical protein
MVLLKNVGKYGGASFPFFLVWGAAGVYHSTSESADLGWDRVGARAGKDLCVLHVHTMHYIRIYTHMHSIDPCVIQKS